MCFAYIGSDSQWLALNLRINFVQAITSTTSFKNSISSAWNFDAIHLLICIWECIFNTITSLIFANMVWNNIFKVLVLKIFKEKSPPSSPNTKCNRKPGDDLDGPDIFFQKNWQRQYSLAYTGGMLPVMLWCDCSVVMCRGSEGKWVFLRSKLAWMVVL